jgi:hypothetical protein
MSGPPSLSFKVGRSRWQAATGSLFLGFGAVTTLGMVLSPHHFSPLAVVSAVVAFACTGLAFLRVRRNSPVGTLHWDGTHWHWADSVDYSVQSVRVAMDFQRWMLVRLERESARPVWLWLERGAAPNSTWMALRRALAYAARQSQPSAALEQDGAYP